MIAYLILANTSLVICYLLYHLVLRKLTFFQGNRIYLLVAVLLSFTLPAIQFVDLSEMDYKTTLIPAISLELTEFSIPEIEIVGKQQFWQLHSNVELVYWVSIIVATSFLLIRLYKLYRRFHKADGSDSFSFLNFVYIGEEVKENEIIHRHELVHVQQGHSYDILFLEIVRVFNWFNPVFFFYIRELKFQHECIADQLCAAKDKASYAELLIANALRVSTDVLSHGFATESILKKRIMMLFQNKSKKSNQWKYMLIIPIAGLVGLVGLVLNNTVDAKTELIDKVIDVKLPVVSEAVTKLMDIEPEGVQQEKILSNPEVLAQPSGGMQAYQKYIRQNFKYSQEMLENGINGTVEIAFVVEKDGRITNVKTKNDIGFGAGAMIQNLVKNGKKWKPAIQNGKAVRSSYSLPVKLAAGSFGPAKSKSNKETSSDGSTENIIRFPPPIITKDEVPKKKSVKSSEDVVRFPPPKVTKDEVPKKKPIKSSPDEVRFPEPKKPEENTVIFSAVEVKPAPPRGMRDFMNYVGENYNFPKEALENNINGVVEVSFIVEKDGSLSNFDIKRDLKYGTGQEAVNVLKNYPEKWKPAIQNGQHVRVAYTMPIRLNTAAQ
ncbi:MULTISPECIES: energy transducer TonB [Sphingobacterium]|uniref:energy transducer TonB n=1 Tax=Sphingobacterium TaxID=28453 RepID=UPI001053E460|nr:MULTISPECIES: energy transducer TonB [Sphingobacterium]MCW2261207.1 outer membrane biosynthesis protein TonB [Sphingobacterium kitahiroshimense]TCR02521.1 outer membrane biosynthesis protein TonB [Sphingobacterium sp. JUb78]